MARLQEATPDYCGRRLCRDCGRGRLLTDFGVAQWADKEKTRPRYIKGDCRPCLSRREATKQRQRREQRKIKREIMARAREFRHVREQPAYTGYEQWVDTGNGHVEDVSQPLGINAAPGSLAITPETQHIADAWSEEFAPPTPYRSHWWENQPTELEQGLALVA